METSALFYNSTKKAPRFTATGLRLSMYLKNPGPTLSAQEFCARCVKQDLANFEHQGLPTWPIKQIFVAQVWQQLS